MLRFCDSFLHLPVADYQTPSKWTSIRDDSTQIAISAGAGRWGGQCIRFNTSNSGVGIRKTLDAQNEWYIGAAVYLAGWSTDRQIFEILDNGTVQMGLRIDANGRLQLERGTTYVTTGTQVLTTGAWWYIELGVTINNTTGVAVARINEVDDITYNGDTQNTANATANMVGIGGMDIAASGIYTLMCDFYACDGQASSSGADTFLGDVRVECLYPTGNGNSSQFIGSDGNSTNNYLLVDEATENGETDYVQSQVVGEKDTYTMGDLLTSAGTVYGIQPSPYARKTDAGARTIASVARLSATETDGPAISLSTSYQCLPDIRETKPGGGQWTISDVNSAEFGVKVAS